MSDPGRARTVQSDGSGTAEFSVRPSRVSRAKFRRRWTPLSPDVLSTRHEIYRPTPWAVPGKSVHVGCDGDNAAKSTLESLKSPEIKIVPTRNNTAVVRVRWRPCSGYESEITEKSKSVRENVSPIRFFFSCSKFREPTETVSGENNLRAFVPPTTSDGDFSNFSVYRLINVFRLVICDKKRFVFKIKPVPKVVKTNIPRVVSMSIRRFSSPGRGRLFRAAKSTR